jgi:hypothetical protein
MDLADAADELYRLTPDAFTERRQELVRQAREAGDRALATEIGKLRRPTVSAWLINRLVQDGETAFQDLSGFAAEFRAAHRNLDGEAIRQLAPRRQALLNSLTDLVAATAARSGKPATDAVLREVRETLEAAVADEQAEQAVRTGQLVRALSYAGFGEVDLSQAVARPRHLHSVPDVGPGPEEEPLAVPTSADTTSEPNRLLERAEAALAEARQQGEAAEAELADAEQAYAEAGSKLAAVEAELLRAKRVRRITELALREAQRAHKASLSEQEHAERALERIRSAPQQD